MGTSTIATQARPPPSSMRTQKGTITESGAWRLRSRSYSHDNELYRMGLRKTAQGEWAAVDNKVPAGLANAMRKMRIRSATRIKREPSVDVDMDAEMEDADNADAVGEGDMREMVVFDYEEIRVYIDVEREIEGGHVHVDEEGMEVETVMRSVETKSEFIVDVKMGGSESGGTPVRTSGDARPSNGMRDSLASIVEEEEDRMDVDPLVIEDQPEDARDSNGAARQEARTVARRKKRWKDPEIHYVGALLDAGYKPAAIPDLFFDRFPNAPGITVGSVEYCRSNYLCRPKHAIESRMLGLELGLESGKWKKMDRILKTEAALHSATAATDKDNRMFIEQEAEIQMLKGQHRWQLADGQAKLSPSNMPSYNDPRFRMVTHSQLWHMFITQREQWRQLLEKQCRRRLDAGLPVAGGKMQEAQSYLRQLTIMVQQSRNNSEHPGGTWKTYVLPAEYEHSLTQKLMHHNPRSTYVTEGDVRLYVPSTERSLQLFLEYDAAKLLLWQQKGPLSESEYHKEALDLLEFDEESLEVLREKLKERRQPRLLRTIVQHKSMLILVFFICQTLALSCGRNTLATYPPLKSSIMPSPPLQPPKISQGRPESGA